MESNFFIYAMSYYLTPIVDSIMLPPSSNNRRLPVSSPDRSRVRKIIVNVKKLTGRLRGAKGELPQEISSRGGGYTTCKFNIFKNDKCQKNELRFKRGSGVESIRGAGHNKNPKLQL